MAVPLNNSLRIQGFLLVSLFSTSHNFDRGGLLLDLQLDQVLLQDVVHDGQLAGVIWGCFYFWVSHHKVVKDCAENLNIILL